MKKLIIILLVLSLIGCSQPTTDADMESIKAELEALKAENQDLTGRLDELNKMIEHTNVDIKDIDNLANENKSRIDVLTAPSRGITISKDYLRYMTTFSFDAIRISENYSRINGQILSYDEKSNTMVINTIEMVGEGDFDRIEELGIDKDQPMIEASYMYNHEDKKELVLDDHPLVYLLDFENGLEFYEMPLSQYLEKYPNSNAVFMIDSIDGEIFRITERFFN